MCSLAIGNGVYSEQWQCHCCFYSASISFILYYFVYIPFAHSRRSTFETVCLVLFSLLVMSQYKAYDKSLQRELLRQCVQFCLVYLSCPSTILCIILSIFHIWNIDKIYKILFYLYSIFFFYFIYIPCAHSRGDLDIRRSSLKPYTVRSFSQFSWHVLVQSTLISDGAVSSHATNVFLMCCNVLLELTNVFLMCS